MQSPPVCQISILWILVSAPKYRFRLCSVFLRFADDPWRNCDSGAATTLTLRETPTHHHRVVHGSSSNLTVGMRDVNYFVSCDRTAVSVACRSSMCASARGNSRSIGDIPILIHLYKVWWRYTLSKRLRDSFVDQRDGTPK